VFGPFPHRENAHPIRFKTGIIICSGDIVLVVVFGDVAKLGITTALLHKSGGGEGCTFRAPCALVAPDFEGVAEWN
jgi:hypothetical protein